MTWDALLPLSIWPLAIAFALTGAAAALQGVVGFGFSLLTVPVLSLVDPALAPVPQLPLLWVLTFAMFWRERHAVDLRGVLFVLIGRLPGAALGLLLLELADVRALDVLLGAFVLASVLIVTSGVAVRRTRTTQLAAGAASATFSMVSSIGGPPLALLYREAPGPTLRASLALIFLIGLVITMAGRLAVGDFGLRDLHIAALLLPALGAGVYASRFLTARVEGRGLRTAVLVVSGLAGAALVVRGVLG